MTLRLLGDAVFETLLLALDTLLPSSWSRALLPRADHFPPHARINFEGYYTRIHCDNDDSIILITSSVPTAKQEGLPYFVHCSYAPAVTNNATASFRADAFPQHMQVTRDAQLKNGVVPFTLDFGQTGSYSVGDEQQSYHLSFPDGTKVTVNITQRQPLFSEDPLKTPHGIFARLVHLLPLHWEIFSPQGRASYEVSKNGQVLTKGQGTAHIEKNWGVSFPSGWTWSQGFTQDRQVSYALAGGHILGNKAMMLVLKTPKFTWSFKPIWTISVLGLSLGFSEQYDNKKGELSVSVNDAFRKVTVNVKSNQPLDEWTYLHCPMATGHNNTTAWETFQAVSKIQVYQRSLPFAPWQPREAIDMPASCCLEFGGTYSSLESKKSV